MARFKISKPRYPIGADTRLLKTALAVLSNCGKSSELFWNYSYDQDAG